MKFSPRAQAAALTFGAILVFGLDMAAPAMAQNTQGRFLDVIVRLDDSFSPGRGAAGQAAAAGIARSLGVEPSHGADMISLEQTNHGPHERPVMVERAGDQHPSRLGEIHVVQVCIPHGRTARDDKFGAAGASARSHGLDVVCRAFFKWFIGVG